MGKSGEASLLVERLPEREVPSPAFLRVQGRAFRAAGRVVDAEQSFREALALLPGDAGLAADLATTLVGQHRFKDALPFAREAVSLRPTVAAYQALLGFVADRLDLLSEARRALETARELAPNDPETHSVLGFHLLRTAEWASAIACFEASIAADPRRAEPFFGLAKAQLAAGRWDASRRAWTEALAIDPSRRDPQFQRALRLAHPWLRPVHRLGAAPAELSLALALVGALTLWYGRWNDDRLMIGAATAMFAVAAISPLARRVIGAFDG